MYQQHRPLPSAVDDDHVLTPFEQAERNRLLHVRRLAEAQAMARAADSTSLPSTVSTTSAASRTRSSSGSSPLSGTPPSTRRSSAHSITPTCTSPATSPPMNPDLHVNAASSPQGYNGQQGIAQRILSPGPLSPTQQPLSYLESMLLLTQGATFVKFNRRTGILGSMGISSVSSRRYVFYEREDPRSMGVIYWCKPGRRVKNPAKCIQLRDITALYEQASTESFPRDLSIVERSRCFSILTKDRSLDLQAESVAQRDLWMHCIHQIMIHAGYGVREDGDNATDETGTAIAHHHSRSPGSATVAALHAADELNRLSMVVTSPDGSPSSVCLSPPDSCDSSSSDIDVGNGHLHTSHLSPGRLQRVVYTPMAAGSQCTPANSPMGVLESRPMNGCTNVNASNTFMLCHVEHSLSPHSNAVLPLPHDPLHEIEATVSVPDERLLPRDLISPSDHPTRTPACSPARG